MIDRLEVIRARLAELGDLIETTEDEGVARIAADEQHRLMNELDNVRELRPSLGEEA